MGPLLPFEIISQGWALIIIFIAGSAIGMVFEQSGLASSKKLMGLFYGYDFVLIKVFFTAGITAMVGIFFMNWFGIVDIDMVFINSNFLKSAIVGGAVMGVGFILGGLCPGTGLTAAVTGKIDALVFVAGIFIGVLLYGLFISNFTWLQTGVNFERVLISDILGISKNLTIAIFILMALLVFGVISKIEKKKPIGNEMPEIQKSSYSPEIFMSLVLLVLLLAIPPVKPRAFFEKNQSEILTDILNDKFHMDSEELAFNIMFNTKNIEIVDIRNRDEYRQFHFIGSANIPYNSITNKQSKKFFKQNRNKKIVLVSNGGVEAAKAWMLCKRRNYENVYVLKGGLNQFTHDIFFDNTETGNPNDYLDISKYRFRREAANYFNELK